MHCIEYKTDNETIT